MVSRGEGRNRERGMKLQVEGEMRSCKKYEIKMYMVMRIERAHCSLKVADEDKNPFPMFCME